MLGLAVALFILASLPVILIYPYVGILVWSWIGFMNPHKLSWGLSRAQADSGHSHNRVARNIHGLVHLDHVYRVGAR